MMTTTPSPFRLRLPLAMRFAALLLAACLPALAQDVAIEKATNGIDADVAPGPAVVVGSTVTWSYVVTAGGRDLDNVVVTDDQGVTVTCPATTVGAGESMTCMASGTAVLGQYANVGTVVADVTGVGQVTASDPSHYFGQAGVAITIVKSTNGQDANVPPGPVVAVGSPINWTYFVTNVSNGTLSNVTVTDDQGAIVSCPATTLNAGSSMNCTASDVAIAGQYANVGTVTADLAAGGSVIASDASHYFGQTQELDFGDAPDPTFPTTFAAMGASHVVGSNVYLGACVDAELDGQPTAAADGDDTATGGTTIGTCAVAGDDEDGVTFTSPLEIGTTASVDVVANADCTLSAWIDWNRDGDWSDLDETLFPGGQPLVAGVNSLSIPVPLAASSGLSSARFRCTTDGEVAPTGRAEDGEVEDDRVAIVAYDLGDAPDPTFPTLRANGGAQHALDENVYLGACVDAEVDGQPNAGATGDDSGAGFATYGTCATPGDDEDGATFTTPYVGGASGAMDVVAHAPCTLSAWIDWNGDGDWSDAGENLFPGGQALGAGVNNLTFPVSQAAQTNAAAAVRLRCTTAGPVGVTGAAPDGEVEDYLVSVQAGLPSVHATKTVSVAIDADGDGQASPGDTLAYHIAITNTGTVDGANVELLDTPDPHTALVVGSVATAGMVTSGNTAGDTVVGVTFATVAANGGTATVDFQVLIDDPLPSDVMSIANQGTVSGDNVPILLTDDPATGAAADPTVISLRGTPVVQIPTLDGLGLTLLVLVLAALSLLKSRRMRIGRSS